MTDIFLSYARADIERVRPLAQLLEDHGWSLWWDRDIPKGEDFSDVIDAAIAESRTMVVVWSKKSVVSKWVRGEAREGLDNGRGVFPVKLDDAKPPIDFRGLQEAHVGVWDGSYSHPELEALVASLEGVLGRPTPAIDIRVAEAEPTPGWVSDVDLDPEALTAVIGPRGVVIRHIQDVSGATVSVQGQGRVRITAQEAESVARARTLLQGIVPFPRVGHTYVSCVRRRTDSGVVVEFLPGIEGFYSEDLADSPQGDSEPPKSGDAVTVQLLVADRGDGYKVSWTAALAPLPPTPPSSSTVARPGPTPVARPPIPSVFFRIGRRDPAVRARGIARWLAGDLIAFYGERYRRAAATGTLLDEFHDELELGWAEYAEQVGGEFAEGEGRAIWTNALNEVLGKGEDLFTMGT